MKKIVKLTESDLTRIVKRVIEEQTLNNALGTAGKWAAAGSFIPGAGTVVGGILGFVVGILDGGGAASEKVKKTIDACAKSKYPITPRTNQLADSVYDAIQGLGTDETKVYKTMSMPRTLDEFCGVVKSYKSSYKQDLYSALDGDFDSEDEWVHIMRPLRNVTLKSQQLQKSKTAQQRPQTASGGGGRPVSQQRQQTASGGGGRPKR